VTTLCKAVRRSALLLAFVVTVSTTNPPQALAANLDQVVEFSIPAGTLASALIQFSKQAHVQILSSAARLEHATTDGLEGKFTINEGLTRLLKGSGLRFRQGTSGAIAIQASDADKAAAPDHRSDQVAARAKHGSAEPLSAQDSELAEVIVTSTYREQRLIDVPLAIAAVESRELNDIHVKDFSDVAMLVPNYVSGSNYGYLRNSSMRGISSNQYGFADESSIAMYVDGVFQGRATAGNSVNAIFDVDRVEVIKGPQASLFGHSAIGGAINVIRNQPTDEFTQSYDAGFGERDRVVARGVVNVPVTDHLAVRISADSENQHGYITNLNGATLEPLDIKAGRVIARYTGIDGLEGTFSASYEERRQNGSTHSLPTLPDFTADITTVGDQNYANFYIFDTGMKLIFKIAPSLKLSSETTFRKVTNAYIEKYDALPTVVGGP